MPRALHPKGTFEAKVASHAVTASKTGTPQIAVKFETEKGEVMTWLPMTEAAQEYTVGKVLNMGFKGNSLEELGDGECIRGNDCQIVVDHEEYQGVTRDKVKFINPAGYTGGDGVKTDAVAAATLKKYDGLLHKMQNDISKGAKPGKAAKAAKEAAKEAEASKGEPPPFDESVPF